MLPRHGILGSGAYSITAQALFHNNFHEVVNRRLSLEEDIDRYQNTLKYASSTPDYSVGEQLYMIPSDMLLRPLNTVVEGYNDKIVINNAGIKIGKHHKKKAPQLVSRIKEDRKEQETKVMKTTEFSQRG